MRYINAFLVVALALLVSCAQDSGSGSSSSSSSPSAPSISFSYGQWGVKSYGSYFIPMTLHHNGGPNIYNASCDIQALNGNTIVDSAFVYFANGSTITSGQSAVSEGIFFNITSSAQFTDTKTTCDWLP